MIVRTLLFPAVVGSAVLFVGMSYCWLGIGGSYKKKVLWFIFAPLFLLSMPVYYFVYYRPLASRQTEQALVPHLRVRVPVLHRNFRYSTSVNLPVFTS